MEEDQFILRLPPPLVDRVRFALSSNRRKDAAGDGKKSSNFRLDFTDERNATFFVDNVAYPASLVDLPALAETHKTADKRTFYKSGDVHQMLIVRMPDDPKPDFTILPDGLSPAARNAGKRLAEPPKTFPPDMIESIEQRIKYVIDHKVKFKPKKDTPAPPTVEEEVVIEEETIAAPVTSTAVGAAATSALDTSTDDSEQIAPVNTQAQDQTPASLPQLPPLPPTQPQTPLFAATPIDAALLAPVAPSPMPDAPTPADGLMSPSIAGPDTPANMDTPAGVDTPLPDGDDDDEDDDDDDEDDDDDDEDDEDFAELADELLKDEEEEARKRIERANLDVKIAEQKRKVADVQAQAERAPNALLKSRIISKQMELQGILDELEKNRATLGD